MVNVVDGDHFVRQKLVCAVVEHCRGEVLHDWLGLHVQVPNHGIAIPPPNDSDKVDVDLATKQRHGTASAWTPGADFMGLDTGSMDVCGHG
jgi:hypothetical protein